MGDFFGIDIFSHILSKYSHKNEEQKLAIVQNIVRLSVWPTPAMNRRSRLRAGFIFEVFWVVVCCWVTWNWWLLLTTWAGAIFARRRRGAPVGAHSRSGRDRPSWFQLKSGKSGAEKRQNRKIKKYTSCLLEKLKKGSHTDFNRWSTFFTHRYVTSFYKWNNLYRDAEDISQLEI